MKPVRLLRQVRGVIFFIGFVLSKIKYIPYIFISPYFHLVSLIFYLTGHLLSYIGSHIEPEHSRKEDSWYGFLPFREQYRVAATIGIIATLLSIASYYVPFLIVLASWLFLTGNTIKSIGEYHKLNSPPTADKHFSFSRQNSFFLHSTCNCLTSTVSAISTTLVFLFPAASLSIMGFATLITLSIGAASLEHWLDCHFGEHPKPCDSNSYSLMCHTMDLKLPLDNNPSIKPRPTQPLFCKSNKDALFNSDSNNFTCTLLR